MPRTKAKYINDTRSNSKNPRGITHAYWAVGSGYPTINQNGIDTRTFTHVKTDISPPPLNQIPSLATIGRKTSKLNKTKPKRRNNTSQTLERKVMTGRVTKTSIKRPVIKDERKRREVTNSVLVSDTGEGKPRAAKTQGKRKKSPALIYMGKYLVQCPKPQSIPIYMGKYLVQRPEQPSALPLPSPSPSLSLSSSPSPHPKRPSPSQQPPPPPQRPHHKAKTKPPPTGPRSTRELITALEQVTSTLGLTRQSMVDSRALMRDLFNYHDDRLCQDGLFPLINTLARHLYLTHDNARAGAIAGVESTVWLQDEDRGRVRGRDQTTTMKHS